MRSRSRFQPRKNGRSDADVEPEGQGMQRPQAVPHDVPAAQAAQLVTSLPFHLMGERLERFV